MYPRHAPPKGLLGDFLTDVQNIANTVGQVSQQLQPVVAGTASLAVVPQNQASISIPIPGKPYSLTIPTNYLLWGGGALLLLLLLRRR